MTSFSSGWKWTSDSRTDIPGVPTRRSANLLRGLYRAEGWQALDELVSVAPESVAALDSWLEVAIAATIFAVGNILFGHFEERTPKWRRVTKVLVFLAITRLVTVQFGRPWSF